VDLLAVKIGGSSGADGPRLANDLQSYAAGAVDVAQIADPVDAEIDAVLQRLDGRRLVIDADLAGRCAVLNRLHRLGELDSADTAVLTTEPGAYLSRLGLPSRRAEQLALAVRATSRLVGVLRDDSGGLCTDGAVLTGWPFHPVAGLTHRATSGVATAQDVARTGREWWVRAVVDDERLSDGRVQKLAVRRLGPDRLEATVQLGRFRRRSYTGRSLQLACDPAQIVADGVERERPRSKRTFWSEPKLWRLALP
jgi:hypothetical protein